MEERVRRAKELRKIFDRRQLPIAAIWMVLMIPVFVGVYLQKDVIVIGFGIVFFIFWMLSLSVMNMWETAGKIMYARALVGKEISEDPYKEGCERAKKFRARDLREYRRKCARVFYTTVSGAMAVGSLLDQIPQLKGLGEAYRKFVKKMYRRTADFLLLYQMGCYDEANEDQFYDLVTYFVQDGKNFVAKSVKAEAVSFIWNRATSIFWLAPFVLFGFTKNPVFAVIAVVMMILSIVLHCPNTDQELLCDFIEYVDTHELNRDLKEKLVLGVKTGNTVLDFKRAYYNPSDYNLRKVANGVEDILEDFDNK